ncbi:hypothetical protein Tco_0079971 [Tanacetum coccineum]
MVAVVAGGGVVVGVMVEDDGVSMVAVGVVVTVRYDSGLTGKTPPEKFSGGGAAVVAGEVAGDGGGAVAG